MRIRSDLVGVVHAHIPGSGVVVLAAGDTVPDGVVIGKHLTDAKPVAEPAEEVPDGDGVKRGRRDQARPSAHR